jgi:hypothetical protein
MATPEEHIKAAGQLLKDGDRAMNDERGSMATLTTVERAHVQTGAYLGAMAHLMFGAAAEE